MRPVRPKPVCTSSATNTIPSSAQSERTESTKAGSATRKPPSPATSSITTQATLSAPSCWWRASSKARRASAAVTPRYGYGYGSRKTSGAKGPMPSL